MDGFQAWVDDAGTGLHGLRMRLAAWLAESALPDPERSELVLATHEAVANALEHAQPRAPVLVRGVRRAGDVLVEVVDRGRWREPETPRSEGRGRGLELIRGLVSDAEIVVADGGTTVRMRQDVRAAVGGGRRLARPAA